MANNSDCLDWDSSIEDDGSGTIILPEGDYNFEVTNFERGRFPGGPKMPPCNKASLTLAVNTDNGTAYTYTDLMLYKTVEWKLSAFFRCIGQKKHGERLVMDWSKVVGSKGRAHFKPRSYTDKNGNDRQANDVDRFYDYDPKFFKDEPKKSTNKKANFDDFMNIPEGDDDGIPFD